MTPRAAAATQPNIILLVDDMDARMLDDLPGLRALLVDRGVSFTAAYAAAPVCCPSRASILRGQYPHNTGVLANGGTDGGFGTFRERGNEQSTMATWLQAAGYRTGIVGKYLNAYEKSLKHVAPGWNRWFVHGGKGKYRAYAVSDQGKVRGYGKKKQNKHYQTDVLTRKAVDFIRTTPASTPFFLYLAPAAPHEPAAPANRHKKSDIAASQAPRVPSFDEEDMSDKPAVWRNKPSLSRNQIKRIDGAYRRQLKSMLAVQDMIQELFDVLQGDGRLANTYIFFTSDNGYHHGEHRIGLGKNTPFEESTRAPLIAIGPGIPAGVASDAMVSHIDLAPTFAELAGATAPGFVDGRSLAPVLGGGTPAGWRESVISELPRGMNGGFVVLRDGPHAYTEYGDGERELYDLASDPYQLENFAGNASPALLASLHDRLDALARCQGNGADACRAADGGA